MIDMAKLQLLVLLLVQFTSRGCVGERGNSITHIKGFDGPLPFSLETGYVEVEETQGVELFYYFIQSERNPREDPLILWISGGPGCSGLNALFFEIGPLKFDVAAESYTEPRLVYFEDSWTKVSNVLFLDAPVGTGFSYAREPQGLNVSLTETGRQLRIFLEKWLAAHHPELAANPLYVGGDSYSGLTVPVTALEIANHGANRLNLKGYMVGNPKTDDFIDPGSKVPFMHGMGLISDELYEAARGSCRGEFVATPATNALCADALQVINAATSDINPSHILEPTCEGDYTPPRPRHDDAAPLQMLVQVGLPDESRCVGYRMSVVWADNAEVRETLGVREGSVGSWRLCTTLQHLRPDVSNAIPYHRELTQRGYRALVYSGDHDMLNPFVGTQAWIRTLGYPVVAPWRPWYSNRGQVAGFTTEYAYNLTFATVKGAGHIASESHPKECLDMVERWTSSSRGKL